MMQIAKEKVVTEKIRNHQQSFLPISMGAGADYGTDTSTETKIE